VTAPETIITGPAAFARAFDVSRETIARLTTYAALLPRWQKAVNLVAPGTLDELWHRHFADSAQLAALIPPTARRHADLGSGGGFPGLVLAIMLADRGTVTTTLVESDQRKAAFLREAARATGIAVEIVTGRIENPETHAKVAPVDVVTARALAPLDRLLVLAAPLCNASSVCLFLKGRSVEPELADAARQWQFMHRLVPSMTQAGASIVEVKQLSSKSSPS
jgi:16S rRNA (guanine527-N7)-methyltransferase